MKKSTSRLISCNKLEQGSDGLWVMPGTDQQPFAYSDGDEAENYVHDVIANASDTSSTSAELEAHIRDWPSEYHFTSKRSTLLRALDLSSLGHVLELGCGCGAISRYLGEQGMQVDAIEGSTRRAQIAHSRCRDLDNVNIVNANYNDLSLPDGEYDAIFLIGVLEYAKRFCPDAKDDFAAVHEILMAIGKSLKPEGVMITAIENRLGLKYLLGATEDHYAVPYIGLHEYPDSAGIRTFDHSEWQQILDNAGFPARTFYTPFPDYKIPSVVLHESFLEQPQSSAHLRGIVSRDYLHEFSSDIDEGVFWKAFQQNRSLLQFANSFLIIAGQQANQVASIAASDFVHVSGEHRKPGYRTITHKLRDSDMVSKQHLSVSQPVDVAICQLCTNEEYISGELLSEQWLNTLMIWGDMERMNELSRRYYEFLTAYVIQADAPNDVYDILPFNIIVTPQGEYRPFDREWQLATTVTPEFVLFRALFWFTYGNIRHMAGLFRQQGFASIQDFIAASFKSLELDLDNHLDQYIETEQRMQDQIGLESQDGLIRLLLEAQTNRYSGKFTFHPRIYWADKAAQYSEDKSLKQIAALGAVRQHIVFDVANNLSAGSRIRFDPAEQEGYFHIYRLSITDSSGKMLVDLHSAAELAQAAKMNGTVLHGGSSRAVFVANNDDPWFEFQLPADAKGLRLIVEMDWPHSEEYEIVRAELQQLNNEWQWEKEKLVQEIATLKREHNASSRTDGTPQQGVLTKVLKKLKR